MRVTVLGSGTGIPAAGRCGPGFLVDDGRSRSLLDLGSGILRRLAETGLQPGDVSRIFLTHLHPDHTADFVPFLFASRHGGGGRTEPLDLMGPLGTEAWVRETLGVYGRWVAPRFALNVREVLDETWSFGGARVASRQMAHEAYSVGYRWESGAGSVAFTGDTGEHPGLVELARGVGILFAECSLPDPAGQTEVCAAGRPLAHLAPSSLARIAREAGPRRLVVTHVFPPTDPVAQAASVRALWGGDVVAASDLDSFDVGKPGGGRDE